MKEIDLEQQITTTAYIIELLKINDADDEVINTMRAVLRTLKQDYFDEVLASSTDEMVVN